MSESIKYNIEERIQANGRKIVVAGILMMSAGLGVSWATYDSDVARSEMEAIKNCDKPLIPNSEGPARSPCADRPPLSEVGTGLLVLGGAFTACTGVVVLLDKEPADE